MAKTRSAEAELGVRANTMRAAFAHVGNLWPLVRHHMSTVSVKTSMSEVSMIALAPTHAER